MTFFATLAVPALTVALVAYGWARRRKQRSDTPLFVLLLAVLLYGPLPYIILQRGTLLRWEMLLDHLIGMVLLGVVAAVAFVSGQKERKR